MHQLGLATSSDRSSTQTVCIRESPTVLALTSIVMVVMVTMVMMIMMMVTMVMIIMVVMMIFELDEKAAMERNQKDIIAKRRRQRRDDISDQKRTETKICIVKEDEDDFGRMTIQQWACLDGLSKSFREDNT